MKFVGRLVKQSAAIEYKRSQKVSLTFDNQKEVLLKLIKKSKKTQFGLYHGFNNLVEEEDFITPFQKNVPIVTYEQFYESWLYKVLENTKNVILPGKIQYFALSSGTTGAPSKKIPVSKNTIRSFQKTSIKQISVLYQLDLPIEFYQKQVLVVGGSSKLEVVGEYFQGDLSGILKKHTKKIATPFTQPSKKISDIKDWYKKLEKIVEEAPKWDIGLIAGIPSWCVLLIEQVVKKYNLNTIHDIWPNLRVYIHGGVFIEPYMKRLERICDTPLFLFDTYLASEGYFAYQQDVNNKSMRLLLNNGIFYEFVPFTSEYFSEDGVLIDKYKAFTLEEVKEGVDYALIISTNAGLWRYSIGDTIQFTNVALREIKITGRTKQFLSLAGEHISLDNIQEAIDQTNKKLGVEIEEYTIFADKEHSRHSWSFGYRGSEEISNVMKSIDEALKVLNDDYASARKYTLKDPIGKFVDSSQFLVFLEKSGKLGAQNKFPRVMNEFQYESWLKHIESN